MTATTLQASTPNDVFGTCDAINYTGSGDGVYIERLNDFLNFVAANPGKVWAIGGEMTLGGTYGVDPFMYAIFL